MRALSRTYRDAVLGAVNPRLLLEPDDARAGGGVKGVGLQHSAKKVALRRTLLAGDSRALLGRWHRQRLVERSAPDDEWALRGVPLGGAPHAPWRRAERARVERAGGVVAKAN